MDDMTAKPPDQTCAKQQVQIKSNGLARRHDLVRSMMVVLLCCGGFGLGYIHARLQSLSEDRRALIWALSNEGQRARKLASDGLIDAIDTCIGQDRATRGNCCSIMPGATAGATWAFCISTID